ncbi:serine/threonine-protein kinase [Desulfococcaceae bacterium HSG9]|nr:serine/threonine-protein kinase [Desulfococcaceae bacterium HSG9]
MIIAFAIIIPFFSDSELDKSSGKPFLVMEYTAPGSMEHVFMKTGEPLNPKIAAEQIIGALNGLEYLHAQGIVHRDIKPENVLNKHAENGAMRPLISDFGLSREFSKAGGSVLTRRGTMLGAPLYMPPEQIRDAHNVKEPADIYAMGITLYYLLTGKYPFDFSMPQAETSADSSRLVIQDTTFKSPLRMILEDDPKPIRENNPAVPLPLGRVVDKAIQKEIGLRFRSAREFKDNLERAI